MLSDLSLSFFLLFILVDESIYMQLKHAVLGYFGQQLVLIRCDLFDVDDSYL